MAKVLFEGVKTFWKTKNAINVTIVEHSGHDILELITYDAAIDTFSPRVYIDIERIIPLLDLPADAKAMTDANYGNLFTTFVFNRLSIAKYLPVSKTLEVSVERGYSAKEQEGEFDVVVTRPVDLVPYSSERTKRATSPLTISGREKWRLPLILVRLLKGLPLRASDQTIYAKFSAGKSDAELVDAVARALRTTVSSERAEDLHRIAHSIVLEPQSPLPPSRFCAPSPQTLPPGFAETVKATETARRFSRPSSPAIPGSLSPNSPPSAVVEPSSGSSRSGRLRVRDMLRLPGAFLSSMSNPSSAASSANTSPAGSRSSSPQGVRGSRSASPQIWPTTQTAGVGYEEARVHQPKPMHSSRSMPQIFRRTSPVPTTTSGEGPPDSPQKKPPRPGALGMTNTPPTRYLHDEEDGLVGAALNAVDLYTKHNRPPGPSGGASRLQALRDRRRTFDVASSPSFPFPSPSPTPTTPSKFSHSYPGAASHANEGAGCGGGGGGSTEKPASSGSGARHIRASSGGTLSAMLGLSPSPSRIVPGAWVDEGTD